jgi:hypothetical protein
LNSSWTCNEHAIKKSKSLDAHNGKEKGNQLSSSWTCNEHAIRKSNHLMHGMGKKEVISLFNLIACLCYNFFPHTLHHAHDW